MWASLHLLAAAAIGVSVVTASPFPPKPAGVTVVQVNDGHGSTLSYKQTSICETTKGVKAYSGYVHLPPAVTGEKFNINTFYWFVEARNNPQTAPLTIWLAGGPGESSMDAALGENGPCNINEDFSSTTLNPWSWNGESNMLYIDQPVQSGFSYDTLVNVTLNQLTSDITPADFSKSVPKQNATFLVGTSSSQNPTHVTAGSLRGASALWNFMQIWTSFFPHQPSSNMKISVWGNSYGGFYTPSTFAFFERQNDMIKKSGKSSKTSHVLNLGTMGITNGCIDPLIEMPLYPEMAVNNTYGFKAYSQQIYQQALNNFTKPDGCKATIQQCRSLASTGDPSYQGTNQTVNQACAAAFEACFYYVQGAYTNFGQKRSAFDMAHPALDPFPAYRNWAYLNQASVQADLGVPVNFTTSSNAAQTMYVGIVGDAARLSKSNLEFVLSRGYDVSMMFGDRDQRCGWLGGEAVSLAANWTYADTFRGAGYADLATNASYNGGYVRQAGSFSFARVFQAGHAVMAYQPETAYRIFQRTLDGLDVATGLQKVGSNCSYTTKGPKTVRAVNQKLPAEPAPQCYLWGAPIRCTPQQQQALLDGSAVLDGPIVVKPAP